MQAHNSSNTPQHAANSLQNFTAATRAAPLTRAHTRQRCGGDTMRAVHHEGTQPRAERGIQACCSHGVGREAPGRVVTAVSPTSGHVRRHWGARVTRAHADATRAESGKRGRGLPFTRSSACSCNNCCCRISNCLCSSSNCRLMYSWRHGQQGSKEKEREGKRASISREEGE